MNSLRPSPRDQHLYVIDDDASVRTALARGLGHLGYDVHQFSCAIDFLDRAAFFRPAVLVVDMQMPGLSGVELQAILQHKGWDAPVIFISGASSLSQGITAMRQGAFEFLTKPFDFDALIALIVKAQRKEISHLQAMDRRDKCRRQLLVLKPRELEAFHLLSKGYSYMEMMQAMGISLPTAKQYRAAVMRKLKFETLAQLIDFSEDVGPPTG